MIFIMDPIGLGQKKKKKEKKKRGYHKRRIKGQLMPQRFQQHRWFLLRWADIIF